MDDLIFLHGRFTAACIASVDKRFDYHTVQFMTAGGLELFYDDARHELAGAWVWPANPGPWVRFHEWPRGRPWVHRYIAFTGPRVAAWRSAGMIPDGPEPVAAADVGPLATLFDEMLANANRPDRASRRLAENLLEQFLLRRAAVRAKPTMAEAWLTATLHALDAAKRNVDYAALADDADMALSTLRRRFKLATGVALHQYAMQRRLQTAKSLLERRELSIKQIARQTGYRDVYYFGRHFQQVFGVPPGRYRKSVQG